MARTVKPAGDPRTARPTGRRELRYRCAERAVWEHYGVEPAERFVVLDRPAIRLRVLEVGTGRPVLFLPGTAGCGPVWAPLVSALPGFRSLLLDPPGAGLSDPVDPGDRSYPDVLVDVLAGVLDVLALDRVDLVGASLGNVWALRLAAAHPDRIDGVVLLGWGPLLPNSRLPAIIRLVASPLGALMVRLPQGRPAARAFLRAIGHGDSLAERRIPEVLIDWKAAFDRDTDTPRHERQVTRRLVDWRTGLRPGTAPEPADYARITAPTLLLFGTGDPTGTLDGCRTVVDRLPRGELQVLDGAGHSLWLDDPAGVAGRISRFFHRCTEEESW